MKNKMKFFILALVVFSSSFIFAFDPIVDLNEVPEIFKFNGELIKLEFGEDFEDDFSSEKFQQLLETLWNQESLKAIHFKNYLLQTRNDHVKEVVVRFINSYQLGDSYSQAIIKKYKMKEIEDGNNFSGSALSDNNQTFDEKVNYGLFVNERYFGDKLQVTYPWNDYLSLVDENDQGEDSNKVLVVGGGTNTITIFIEHYSDEDGIEYGKLAEIENMKLKYENISQFEVQEYLFNNEKVAYANFSAAEGKDNNFKSPIRNFECNLLIHTTDGNTYRVNYFLNMSSVNNSIDVFHDLARLVCMYTLMTIAI